LIFTGDGTASRTIDVEKLEEDGSTYTMKFEDIPVGPSQIQRIPNTGYDIENPIMVLEGGSRPYATASGGTPKCTIIYWDDEIR